jgi:hypothetical protein
LYVVDNPARMQVSHLSAIGYYSLNGNGWNLVTEIVIYDD